jgi:hypothetical protein
METLTGKTKQLIFSNFEMGRGRKVTEWIEAPLYTETPADGALLEMLDTFEAPYSLGAPDEAADFYNGKSFFILTVSDGPQAGRYLVDTEGYDYARYVVRLQTGEEAAVAAYRRGQIGR